MTCLANPALSLIINISETYIPSEKDLKKKLSNLKYRNSLRGTFAHC